MPSRLRLSASILILPMLLVATSPTSAETATKAALADQGGAKATSPAAGDSAGGGTAVTGRTGMPLPRFASLRAPQVNLRTGPGLQYPVDWVYKRRGLPVEIRDEFGHWRHIRDWQGTEGWVHQSMLQGKRGILVVGRERLLRESASDGAAAIARVEAGVVGSLEQCDGNWCRIGIGDFEGWLPRDEFYGLLPGERID